MAGVEVERFGRLFGIVKRVHLGLIADVHAELGYLIEGPRSREDRHHGKGIVLASRKRQQDRPSEAQGILHG